MTLDRSLIGRASAPVVYEIEKGAIRRLADAIGDPDPRFSDPAVPGGMIAPPTFPTTFRDLKIEGYGYDPKKVLHGGQSYEYTRPLRAGERITCTARVKDLVDKESAKVGKMTAATVEVRGVDESGALVFTATSTTLIRHI